MFTERTFTVDKQKVEMGKARHSLDLWKVSSCLNVKYSLNEITLEYTVSLQKGKGRRPVLHDVLPT
jgi:hypothetical protein